MLHQENTCRQVHRKQRQDLLQCCRTSSGYPDDDRSLPRHALFGVPNGCLVGRSILSGALRAVDKSPAGCGFQLKDQLIPNRAQVRRNGAVRFGNKIKCPQLETLESCRGASLGK